MIDQLDRTLITLASTALSAVPLNQNNHTVAAAARSRSGLTFVGVNVHHFTGGPCAELVVLGNAAGSGVLGPGITTMVAVARDDATGKFVVINPCGKCRQVLLDYNPNMLVIVMDTNGEETVKRVPELVPFAYVRVDGHTWAKEVVATV